MNDTLELEKSIAFQAWEWRLRPYGWALAAAVLLAGILGVFDRSGPLSKSSAGSPDAGLQIEYSRFSQYDSPDQLEIESKVPEGGQLRLAISRSFGDNISIQRITPEPVRMESDAEDLVLRFASPSSKMAIRIDFEPRKIGTITGGLSVAGGEPIEISTFVYP